MCSPGQVHASVETVQAQQIAFRAGWDRQQIECSRSECRGSNSLSGYRARHVAQTHSWSNTAELHFDTKDDRMSLLKQTDVSFLTFSLFNRGYFTNFCNRLLHPKEKIIAKRINPKMTGLT